MSDRFGDYLTRKGLLKRNDIFRALDVQAESTVKIGTICLEEGYMTVRQVMNTLREHADSEKQFEDIAINLGFLTAQQLSHALKIQRQRRPFLGEILISLGLLNRHVLFEELGHFWEISNDSNRDEKKAAEDRRSKQKKENEDRVLKEVPFPMMYPEELREFREDVGHSMEKAILELTSYKPGTDIHEWASQVAFIINKVRGGAELDGIEWLAAVTSELEKGMLLIAESDEHSEGLSRVVQTYLRAADCVQSYLDSVNGNTALADMGISDEIRDAVRDYGSLGDIVTQDKIVSAYGKPEEVVAPIRENLAGLHILLVDDDTVIRNTLERHLRSYQVEVEQGKNGAIGLERLQQNLSPFDLMIVDLHMPIMDGFELVEEIRNTPEFKDMPVVMFTASLHMADVRKAISLGINGYVIKREWKTCLMPEVCRILGVDPNSVVQPG